MNTIVINKTENILDLSHCLDLYKIQFPENFIFKKFKLIFPEWEKKIIVEFGEIPKIGSAKIFYNKVGKQDFVKWNFEDYEYDNNEIIGKKNECVCGMKDVKDEQDKYVYFATVEEIITVCYYIMTAKREKVYKVKGNAEIKEKGKSKSNREYEKKVFLLDEIVEYVNENGLTVSQNGTHKISCPCWSVRGHYRHYKSGKVIFVENYKKGKERENKELNYSQVSRHIFSRNFRGAFT